MSRPPRWTAVQGLEGTRIGQYALHDCLGHGTHTAVYRAVAPSGETCAVKLVDFQLQGGEDLAQRLRRDAAILHHIGHPRIVPIRDPVTSDEVTAAAMPLLDGPTLHDLMRAGRVDSDLAWTFLSQIAESLQSAHQWGLTYKVLKPANILIKDGRPYLAEFGITGRHAGQVGLATPDCHLPAAQYLAPEQIRGEEPDHRTDIYAFAMLVFELATGAPVGGGARPSKILHSTLYEPPPSAHERNPEIPPEVDRVLRRALARDPGGRHGSVGELIEELANPPAPVPGEEELSTLDAGTATAGSRPSNGSTSAVARPPAAPVRTTVTIDSLIDVLSEVLEPEQPPGSQNGH